MWETILPTALVLAWETVTVRRTAKEGSCVFDAVILSLFQDVVAMIKATQEGTIAMSHPKIIFVNQAKRESLSQHILLESVRGTVLMTLIAKKVWSVSID